MDFNKLVDDQRGGFEKLMGKIPGYKGYKQKEQRREADKLLRQKIAADLDQQRRRLGELQIALINAGQILFTDDLERAVTKLQTLMDRIKTATYGYAGLFDAVKVKENELDQLYAFDAGLLDGVPAVSAGVDKVSEAIDKGGDIGAAIKALVQIMTQFNDLFSKRQEAIQKTGATTL